MLDAIPAARLVVRLATIAMALSLARPAYAMHTDPGSPIIDRDIPGERLSDFDRWTYIVAGESGGGYMPASLLVAWTLRAWQIYRGMPASAAGPRWGWYGWAEPGFEAREAVAAVWNQPLSSAPWDWMRQGEFCFALGSRQDAKYWHALGLFGQFDFILDYKDGRHSMICYFSPESKKAY